MVQVLCILRGVSRALISHRYFNLFFDWFYPQYMTGIIEGTLNAFHSDEECVHACLKLLNELV